MLAGGGRRALGFSFRHLEEQGRCSPREGRETAVLGPAGGDSKETAALTLKRLECGERGTRVGIVAAAPPDPGWK